MKVKIAQSCLTLCNHVDRSLPGSSVHGILQAVLLEWVAIPFSRGSFQPGDRTQLSPTCSGFFTVWVTREAHRKGKQEFINNRSIVCLDGQKGLCDKWSNKARPESPDSGDLCILHHFFQIILVIVLWHISRFRVVNKGGVIPKIFVKQPVFMLFWTYDTFPLWDLDNNTR